ncbi:MAG: bifunctional [glutamate--ammonia ligase]-adenylyl-L-tyrosine phosphorylase/[glutamate--ammonia-ligase] adenylyltransferase [Deltaproteobacteria bacterium]|nr:bifunctional [glutamate--ammonia ligase]-adenylyl-L-tyrosine phosphorylase/[glutamate--ammonia-ligase] adenylyltransferase [Deltaproteobacteria bacterium]MCL5791989.1 bifunctional [glutamate--ammonia ligase]-adenylyl-L-tyrosine phosphorylase/[glutamate--ammonia-ligase] adenylyltransferase [Deltaproteobacteria bacterium]
MTPSDKEALLYSIDQKEYISIRRIMNSRGIEVSEEFPEQLIKVADAITAYISPEDFMDALLSAPDEEEAIEFIHSLIKDDRLKTIKNLPCLIQLSGTSHVLSRYLIQNVDASEKPVITEDEYLILLSSIPFDADYPSRIRQFKNKMISVIAMYDLCGFIDFKTTVLAISNLASSILKQTINYFSSKMGIDLSKGFSIIGMGKLGSKELNYSSDIDIIYMVSDDLYERMGSGILTKFAEQLTGLLSEQTEDGILYRVDLGLRPDGKKGTLIQPLSYMVSYYESWGETWERLAMIKASHVAGDQMLTNLFLEDIQHFIFRRNLDFSTIEALKDIKNKIQSFLLRGMEQSWNVKLGSGGIRELEFAVQVIQLIRGGRDAALRVKPLIDAISALLQLDIIQPDVSSKLTNAYILLRTLEHRIQEYQMLQTQSMPEDNKSKRRVLRGILGPGERIASNADRIAEESLQHAKESVCNFFQQLFYEQEKVIEAKRPDEVTRLFIHNVSDAEIKPALLQLGFRDVEKAMEYTKILSAGIPTARYGEKTKRLLNWLAPVFLKETSMTVDPDAALEHLIEFIRRIGARGIFFSLLKENPKTLFTLIQFFSMSDYLSHLLIKYPENLDALVLSRYAITERSYGEMYEELHNLYKQLKSYEDKLNLLRDFKNMEILRIGINDINGNLNIMEVSEQLSSLADVILNMALLAVLEELKPVYGTIPDMETDGMAVIGMGKLGGKELNYNSDLDLVFIYGSDKPTTKQLSAQEYFSKVVQRFITAISLPTQNGYAYNIDTRLRPSGNLGPLVAHIDAFIQYHLESSMTWEKQALLRARGIIGPPVLLNRLFDGVRQAFSSIKRDESLKMDIHDMRMKLEKSVNSNTGYYNFKKGSGGLMDIEFIVQYLELLYGSDSPVIMERNTFLALELLMENGYISKKDMDILKDGYMFLRKLENRMRIDRDFSVESISMNEKDAYPVALRMGFTGQYAGRIFLEMVKEKTQDIRKVYSAYFRNV